MAFDLFDFPFWIISDTHFGHGNIIKYCDRPYNHDDLMYDAWCDLIDDDDVIVHLGDLSLRPQDYVVDDLPGQKFLLRGNHDKKNAKFYSKLGFTIIEKPFELLYNDWRVYFSHEPDNNREHLVGSKVVNVHGHIHEKNKDDRRFINVSVEQTNYKPVQITDVLDDRINELSPA